MKLRNRKKTLLVGGGIGAGLVAISSVVACSSTSTSGVSDQTSEYLSTLNSSEAINYLEEQFLRNIITNEYGSEVNLENEVNDPLIQNALSWYIVTNLNTDPGFLLNIQNQLLAIESFANQGNAAQNLIDLGFNQEYYGVSWSAQNYSISDVAQILFNYNLDLGIKNEIYKLLVVNAYSDTTKESWQAVFDTEDTSILSSIHLQVSDSNFPLIKYAIDERLFMQWGINLNESDSLQYYAPGGVTYSTLAEADTQFLSGGAIDETSFTIRNSNVDSIFLPSVSDASLINLINFGGFTQIGSYTTQGSKKLNFASLTELQKATTSSWWGGYIQESTIVDENIELFQDDGVVVSLERVYGLMPIYENNEFTFNNSVWANDLDILSWNLNRNGSELYNEALEFFTSENGPDYRVDIIDPEVEKIYTDLNISYIK